jgi:hypothetical protein
MCYWQRKKRCKREVDRLNKIGREVDRLNKIGRRYGIEMSV